MSIDIRVISLQDLPRNLVIANSVGVDNNYTFQDVAMENQLLTLSKIFTERLFRIPDYQRGYAWTEKQLKEFWADVQQLEANRSHYTGVITLENVPESTYRGWDDDFWIIEAKNYRPFFLVDGQQRITTAIIAIQAIIETIGDDQKLNYTNKDDIKRKFVFDSKDDGISRSYIFGYEKDNPSYEFLKSKIFCEHSSGDIQETVYTQNLSTAKDFFLEKIRSLPINEIELLYRKITQCLLFNIFTISEEVDVCVAFETMNNRGKPLSYLELLKNRLIYLSLKFNAAETDKGKLRRAINDCWKAIYHQLGRNKSNPLDDDKFLYIHYMIYFGKSLLESESFDSRDYVYRRNANSWYAAELLEKKFISKNISKDAQKERITLNDVYAYVSSLQKCIKIWYQLFNPFDSEFSHEAKIWLDKLNRAGMDNDVSLILIFLKRVEDDNRRVLFLKAVERYQFISRLVQPYYPMPHHLGQRKDSFTIALELYAVSASVDKINAAADKLIRHFTDEVNTLIKNDEFIKAVINKFRSDGYYGWSNIRYFLYEYNLSLQESSKTDRDKIFWPEFIERRPDFMTIEHIYPQQARHEYWASRFRHLTQKQRESVRNSLGNLLPLSKPKNASLSNRPFNDKVDGRQDSIIGYRYGSYAENEVACFPEWTPKTILLRGLKMLEFMEKRWDIIIGDERKKSLMLGLDFISIK